MNDKIGNAAGAIWRFLNDQTEPLNLSNLKKSINLSSTLLMMGLGWLAREDKLKIDLSQSSYMISIKR